MSDKPRIEFLARKHFINDNEKVAVYVAGRRRGKTSALCELIAKRVMALDSFHAEWTGSLDSSCRVGAISQRSTNIVAINPTYGLSREFFRQMSDTLKAKKIEQVVAWNRHDHILAGRSRHLIRIVEPDHAFKIANDSSRDERLDMIVIDNLNSVMTALPLWAWANDMMALDDCFVRITACPSHRENDPVNHMLDPGSPLNPKITARPHIDLPSMSEVLWREACEGVTNEN